VEIYPADPFKSKKAVLMSEQKKISEFILSYTAIYVFYALIVILASLHKLYFTENPFNNFEIFRYSFHHLLENNDLYAEYPAYYFDIFKYNPSFALFMAPFWYLPMALGVTIWNLANALLPVYAIDRLNFTTKEKVFFSLFILIEMITSVQNAQSNGLMLGLMMLTFDAIEKNKPFNAALLMLPGFFIKLFAAAVSLFALFNPKRNSFILSSLILGILIGIAPAVFIGFDGLFQQYQSWFQILVNDKAHELNFSLMTFSERTLGIVLPHTFYLAFGAILLLFPLTKVSAYKNFKWRITYLSAILVWVVIFNHKAESPTFVIAMAGAALWFIVSEKNYLRFGTIVIVFIFTGLSATDLFPADIRENFLKPFAIKVLPCIMLFFFILFDLLFGNLNEGKQLAKNWSKTII
jgi:hypothetical protein